jgi:hypothetical protein
MQLNNKGMSAVAGLLAVVVVILVVVGIGALTARFFLKPTAPAAPQPTGQTFKVDKAKMIADLEKQVKGIPADDVAANVRGYERLLALDPANDKYRQKLAVYRERLKAESGDSGDQSSFVKIAFPAPQVLDQPDVGQMIGRAPSGELVEVLDTQVIRKGSTYITWYRIPYKKHSGWISQMGVFGDAVTMTAGTVGEAPQSPKWEAARRGILETYRGKVTAVEKISPEACDVQVSSALSFEQARQISENIGYFLKNSTGANPVVRVYVGDMQVAVAELLANKYSGKLAVQNR